LNLRLLSLAVAAVGVLAAQPALAETRFKPNAVYAFDDTPWQEKDYTLPAFPQQPSWEEFFLSVPRPNRLFVDTGSLSMGEDGVVRFILRVQSPSGAQNLSVEGIRCTGRQVRSYAFGDNINQRWIESMKPVWRPIEIDDAVHRTLRETLCQDGSPVKDVASAIKQLRATR
jgi:hypothetical protein